MSDSCLYGSFGRGVGYKPGGCRFESHPGQLQRLLFKHCIRFLPSTLTCMDVHVHVGCIVFLCLVVRLILLASFFLPSHLSLKHVSVWLGDVYTHVLMRDERRKKERSKQGQTDKHVHVYGVSSYPMFVCIH